MDVSTFRKDLSRHGVGQGKNLLQSLKGVIEVLERMNYDHSQQPLDSIAKLYDFLVGAYLDALLVSSRGPKRNMAIDGLVNIYKKEMELIRAEIDVYEHIKVY